MKNSWGDTWGQEGYILLERADSEEDEGGECGLLIEATYPILEDFLIPYDGPVVWEYAGDALGEVERPLGFESSATANDCGGGTSDVVFDDGEEEGIEGPREKGWFLGFRLGLGGGFKWDRGPREKGWFLSFKLGLGGSFKWVQSCRCIHTQQQQQHRHHQRGLIAACRLFLTLPRPPENRALSAKSTCLDVCSLPAVRLSLPPSTLPPPKSVGFPHLPEA